MKGTRVRPLDPSEVKSERNQSNQQIEVQVNLLSLALVFVFLLLTSAHNYKSVRYPGFSLAFYEVFRTIRAVHSKYY